MLVLVEKTGMGYRASSGKPLEAETEGATREDALNRLRELLTRRMQGEVEVVDLEIPGQPLLGQNPYLRLHGMFRDDPTFEEWQDTIAQNRKQENDRAGIHPEQNS